VVSPPPGTCAAGVSLSLTHVLVRVSMKMGRPPEGEPGGRPVEQPPTTGLWLHLEADLPAPAAAVFEALTDPRQLARWWGPHGFTMSSIELDLHVGGRYRFAMQPPEGEPFHLQGEYLEIDAPCRLAYTFRWEEPDPDDVDTTLTLTLLDLGASMRLIVEQGAFATEPRRELHEHGWSDSLQRLQTWLSSA
jgi:uncharacterized protein YndB with AHSA1/START domain